MAGREQTVARDMVAAIMEIPRKHVLRPAAAEWKMHVFVGEAYRDILGPVQIVLHEMCVQADASPESSFQELFKRQSYEGYDVVHNRLTDYGNREMTILLHCLRHDAYVNTYVLYLADRWPTLDQTNTDLAFNRQGDIIEICLAAARAHSPYRERLIDAGYSFPPFLVNMGKVLQAIHWLDLAVWGRLKYDNTMCCQRFTLPLRRALPAFETFVRNWETCDINQAAMLLYSVLN